MRQKTLVIQAVKACVSGRLFETSLGWKGMKGVRSSSHRKALFPSPSQSEWRLLDPWGKLPREAWNGGISLDTRQEQQAEGWDGEDGRERNTSKRKGPSDKNYL